MPSLPSTTFIKPVHQEDHLTEYSIFPCTPRVILKHLPKHSVDDVTNFKFPNLIPSSHYLQVMEPYRYLKTSFGSPSTTLSHFNLVSHCVLRFTTELQPSIMPGPNWPVGAEFSPAYNAKRSSMRKSASLATYARAGGQMAVFTLHKEGSRPLLGSCSASTDQESTLTFLYA